MRVRGAQSGREKDRKGPVRAISPDNDRMKQSVASAPLSFDDFFSFDRIVRSLAKSRVRVLARRRDVEFYAAHFENEPSPVEQIPCAVAKFLPPRNQWSRPGFRRRRGVSPAKIAEASIKRTVYGFFHRGTLASCEWGRNLLSLVADVQRRVRDGDFALTPPRLMFRDKGGGELRMLAGYDDLCDKMILKGASDYLRSLFDPLMSTRCHSFRASSAKNHVSAVAELAAYRRERAGKTLFVAECDIRKFFDVLDHCEVLKAFDEFAAATSEPVDPRARSIVEAYLDSYDFNCYPQEVAKADAEVAKRLAKVAKVPHDVLKALHCGEDLASLRLGLPQGGALSPLIANMVLTAADRAVTDSADGETFYLRFCDDMVLVHSDKSTCENLMREFLAAVAARKLPVHEAKTDGFAYGAAYYAMKTKGPFAWCDAAVGEANAAPWLNFLGNQIDFRGGVRIRQETVSRHAVKLKSERGAFMKRMCRVLDGDLANVKCDDPAKFESWLRSVSRHYCLRMVAKGVGFMKAGAIPDDSLGWVAAFPVAIENHAAACTMQMRRLDALRSRLLKPFDAVFNLDGNAPHRFFGRPFSYKGFLEQRQRPVAPESGGKRRPLATPVIGDLRFYGEL